MQGSTDAERTAPAAEKKLLYFADPMCSWCWGFGPVITAIGDSIGGRAGLRIVVGGLRAGETRAMDERSRAFVRHHWEEVERTTGQVFSHAFFDRRPFVYDTEPACRAVVVMRSFAPDAALAYMQRLQRAFYVDNEDVTDAATLARLAAPFGLEPEPFAALFAAAEIAAATRADFSAAHAAGITGFPTVVLRHGGTFSYLTVGYQPFEALKPQLDLWLEG